MKIFLAIITFITSSFNFLVSEVDSILPTPTPDSTSLTAMPTALPSPTPKLFTHPPKPTPPASISVTPAGSSNINDFIYPGSQVISSSATFLSLKNSDDPESIVSWYETKVNRGYSSRSDNISNSNGNVSGTINASNDSQKINISIHKNAGELYTTIEIQIKSY